MLPNAAPEDIEAERLRLEYRLAMLEGQEKAQNTFLGFDDKVPRRKPGCSEAQQHFRHHWNCLSRR